MAIRPWKGDSWSYSGNTNAWSYMSGDEELGYLYVSLGTTTNDYYGGHRLGDNLFSESLVCIDVTTGKRVWHFQTVHAMPRDVASATQPFPTKPAPFDYQGAVEDDLVDFTPELRETAKKAVSEYKLGPLFMPHSLHENGKLGTVFRPTGIGAGNWPGSAVDPETGFLYVPSLNDYGVMHFYTPDPKLGGFPFSALTRIRIPLSTTRRVLGTGECRYRRPMLGALPNMSSRRHAGGRR